MSTYPSISVLVPTYGRTLFLGEVLESYLQQDYPGESELVILNDVAEQKLQWDNTPPANKHVRIINVGERMALGSKQAHLIDLAKHEVITFWDDDDIYLPYRLSLAFVLLYTKVGSEVIARPATFERREWHMDDTYNLILRPCRPFNTVTCFKKTIADVGGFRDKAQNEVNMVMNALTRARKVDNIPQLATPPSTIYRAQSSTGIARITKCRAADGKRLPDSELLSVLEVNLFNRMATNKEPSGIIDLQAMWDRDYVSMVKMAWSELQP